MQSLTLNVADKRNSFFGKKIRCALFSACLLFGVQSSAQTYTSNFTTANGNYSVVNPTGGGCLAPAFANAENIADADLTNYASLSGLLNTELLCTNPNYVLRTRINLPIGVTEVPIGYNAGFRMSMVSVASISILQSSMTIRTYLGGILAQTVTGANIANISLLSGTGPVNLFFTSTAPFDEIELEINNGLIPLSLGFDYRFYHAFATVEVLPVKFGEVAAKIQSGRLNVDWSTVSETNNAKFIVQGSVNGTTWTDLGTVATKAVNGQSSVKQDYSFSTPWGNATLAGFGLLGLFLLPALRNRLLRLGMAALVVCVAISCAKENTSPVDFANDTASAQNVYVRVAQVDINGATTYSNVAVAKK